MPDANLLAITEDVMAAEEASGFARLRRVPGTRARSFLQHRESLSPEEWAVLRRAMVSRGAWSLGRTSGDALVGEEYDAYMRMASPGPAPVGGSVVDIVPLKLLRMMAGAVRSGDTSIRMSPADLERVTATEVAPAALLRKLIKPAFKDAFGLAPTNRGGGTWDYAADGRAIKVLVDFNGRTAQLRYWVTVTDAALGRRIPMLTYEGLLGLSQDWDWIALGGADDAVELLVESVTIVRNTVAKLGATV